MSLLPDMIARDADECHSGEECSFRIGFERPVMYSFM